jgi:hypothetical protein
MRNVYVYTAVAVFLSVGCAPARILDFSDPPTEEIIIHSKNGKLIAQVGGSELEARDCSTSTVRCVRIQDLFTFIYPRKCPFGQSYEALRWKQDGAETFLSVPYPDVGLPAGVYMSSLSDKVSYDYDTRQGLTGIVVAKRPVSDKEHNRGDYEHSYRVKFPTGNFNKFICT